MKKIAISQSNYIPWKGYFDLINSVDVFVLYDSAQYTKNDWRNRNLLMSKRGKQWLSIPVHHSTSLQIKQIQTADNIWWKKHWKTIEQLYCKAKFFELYRQPLCDLYHSLETEMSLSKINYKFILFVNKVLGIETEICFDDTFEHGSGQSEKLLAICQQLQATTYVSAPAAKSYLNESIFEEKNIHVSWFEYMSYPEYDQLGYQFEHTVSILDLLFNEGPRAKYYMMTFK
ncbi:hypothetical protein EPA86_05050 [Litorilituus lipolyticus]|uniref:WbqC family protein n=1 Tax=Litorilituus lipolyticus TaxID=2491017 RepID=A0A502L001_9GAMM|nr:hypothetical protein EPA86_05050 [Litorilituus lipolyticus]